MTVQELINALSEYKPTLKIYIGEDAGPVVFGSFRQHFHIDIHSVSLHSDPETDQPGSVCLLIES